MAFEDNLRELESIVAQLDSDTMDLDRALKLFEQGIALLRQASDELNTVDARVKLLVEEADGAVTTRDLDG